MFCSEHPSPASSLEGNCHSCWQVVFVFEPRPYREFRTPDMIVLLAGAPQGSRAESPVCILHYVRHRSKRFPPPLPLPAVTLPALSLPKTEITSQAATKVASFTWKSPGISRDYITLAWIFLEARPLFNKD